MLPNHKSDPDDEVNLSDFLDSLLQHIWLVIGVFIVVVGIGVAYSLLSTPIFRADALIQVEDKKSSALSGLQEIADALGAGASPVAGEVEILRSREVVMKAVQETRADLQIRPRRFPVIGEWVARKRAGSGIADAPLGLTSYAWGGEVLKLGEFTIPEQYFHRPFILRATSGGYDIEDSDGNVLGAGAVGKLLEFNIDGLQGKIFVSDLVARPGAEFNVVRLAPISAYFGVLSKLSVSEVGKQSSIIQVGFESADVDFAQQLVNSVARAYLRQNVERRSAEADQSLKFLDEQLPEIKRSVERAEDALNKFRTHTNTVSVEKETDTLLGQAVDVEKGRLQLQLKRDELLQRYKAEHPLVKAIDAQLGAIDKKSSEVGEMVNRLPAAQRDLLRLQRDAEVNSEIYITLLNNSQQLKVAKAGTTGNVRIVDFAVKNFVPVAPKKTLILALAGTLGLVLGVGAAIIAGMLRPTVRTAEEVERGTGLVSYANVPESASQERLDSNKRDRKGREAIVEGRSQLLAILHPEDPAVESLRSLRTGMAFALLGAGDKNVVITGATAMLGKSFISANLSALLASADKRVLLIETDMRRPQLGTYFGYENKVGLSDLLAGSKTFEEVVHRDPALYANLDVLPAGQIPPNPGELLLSSRFSALLNDLQDKYDHIILDSAPVLPVGDTLAVCKCASTTFIVVRAEHSTIGEVRDAVRKLEATGSSVKGIIFNGIKRRRVTYGSAYKYYYGYGSK